MAFVGLLLSLLAMASVADAQGTPLVVGVQGTALPSASNATASATKAKKSGDDMARWPCATGCNGHGQCDEGRCVCEAGWTYYDCSIKAVDRRALRDCMRLSAATRAAAPPDIHTVAATTQVVLLKPRHS